jgi:hypothetical protein
MSLEVLARLTAVTDRLYYTEAEAAEKCAIDHKTLAAHARAGHVRYIAIGFGSRRQHRRYAPEDLKELRERLGRYNLQTQEAKATVGD